MQLSLLPLLFAALSPLLCDGTAAGTHLTLSVHIRPESFSFSYLFFLPLLSTSILYAVVKEHARDHSGAGKSCLVPLLGLAQMPAPLAHNPVFKKHLNLVFVMNGLLFYRLNRISKAEWA